MDFAFVLLLATIALGLPVLIGVRPAVVFAIAAIVAFLVLGMPFRLLEPVAQRTVGFLFSSYSSSVVLFSVLAARFYLDLDSLSAEDTVVPPFLAVFGGGSAGAMMADAAEPELDVALKPPLTEYLASTALLVPFAIGPLVAAMFLEISIFRILLATLPIAAAYGVLAHLVYPGRIAQPSWAAVIPAVLNLSPFALAIAFVVGGTMTPSEGMALSMLLLAGQLIYQRGGTALLRATRRGSEEAGGLFITLTAASFMVSVFAFGGLTQSGGSEFTLIVPYITIALAACLGFGGGPIFAILVLLPFAMPFHLENGVSDPIQLATAVLLASEAGRFASARIGPGSGQAAIDPPSVIWISLLFIGAILCFLTDITELLPNLMMGPAF